MGDMGQAVCAVLADSVVDTLYLVPFLFVTYLFMEWLEHRASVGFQNAIRKAGPAGPVAGAVLGIIPQCGFSGVASTLYAARVVTLGTLFAVFLSTSDEMLPIFIAEQVPVETIAAVLGCKVVVGMVAGFAIDAVARATHHVHERFLIHDLCEQEHCACECDTCEACELEGCPECRPAAEGAHGAAGAAAHDGQGFEGCGHASAHGCEHDHDHERGREHDSRHQHHHSIVRSAIKHTLQVTGFVFVVVLLLNILLSFVGGDALGGFIGSNPVMAVFASALVGLIPNCAASVAIAQMYVDGLLGAGPMIAGLLSAAGVGLLVLFRTNRRPKDNVIIVVTLWAIAVVVGLIVTALPL